MTKGRNTPAMPARRFRVDPDAVPTFAAGSYVRAVGQDKGTGRVVRVIRLTELDGERVFHSLGYDVLWMGNEEQHISQHAEMELAPSARGVPSFDNLEDAQQWLEKQSQSGNWVDTLQDSADSASDLDIALRKMLDGA